MDSDARKNLVEKRGYRGDISGDTLTVCLSNNPKAAKWLADRIGDTDKVVLELCCAIGVTLEHLAPVFKRVVGVDIDKGVLNDCRQNLQNLNLLHKVDLVCGDAGDVAFLKTLRADTIIYDIPYWYPDRYYKYSDEDHSGQNPDLLELIINIRKYISEDIVVFAPKEKGYEYFKEVIGECECVSIFVDDKHDRNYVFFGELIKQTGENSVYL